MSTSTGSGSGYLFFDALEAGGQHHREGQVGVAGRVGGAVLAPGGGFFAGLVHGHPYQGGAVAPGPGDVDRGFVAGHQALVGVDPLAADAGDLPGMLQQAGDVALADGRQVILVVGVVEGVLVALEQGLVGVHAAAVDAEDGLGHEGGIDPVDHGDGLDRGPQGHGLVGHAHGLVVAHVDFVLGVGHFVVAVLDAHAHALQGEDGVPAAGHWPRPGAGRRNSRPGPGLRCRVVVGEIEELQLRSQVIGVAFLRGLGQHALQDIAGVARIGGAVGLQDVAEHPGHGLSRPAARAGSGRWWGRAWRSCRFLQCGKIPRWRTRQTPCPRSWPLPVRKGEWKSFSTLPGCR